MHDFTILNETHLKKLLINCCLIKVIQNQRVFFVTWDGGKGGWNGWFQLTGK